MHIKLEAAQQQREALRQTGKTLVFTNGHFDLLHVGHLDYLEKARALGDALFVGINGDPSTERLKGEGRPIVPAAERARLLAALRVVDAVIIFENDTADLAMGAPHPLAWHRRCQNAKQLKAMADVWNSSTICRDTAQPHSSSGLSNYPEKQARNRQHYIYFIVGAVLFSILQYLYTAG